MKKSENLIKLVFLALLCANFLFLTACSDDEETPAATLPAITSQSTAQTLQEGDALSLEVVATGDALTYQWAKDGADISGATAPNYTVSSTSIGDAGAYTCKVSNAAGSVTSAPIAVTISPKAIIDNVENILSSASFEVVGGITDSASGYYADHGNQTEGIYGAFTIKNISRYSLNYYVIVEKIAMPDNHMAGICIGECAYIFGKDLPETRNFPPAGGSIELKAGATTNREVDSYIKLSAGNDATTINPVAATPGQTMLRVTYVNAADETDFIRFKLY